MTGFKSTAIAALFAVMAAPAVASFSFTFDFTGIGGLEPTRTFDGDKGLSVTASPQSFNDLTDTIFDLPLGQITQNQRGLGIKRTPLDDIREINGPIVVGRGELLTFDFSREVRITGVTFGGVDRDDDADIFVNGSIFAEDLKLQNGEIDGLFTSGGLIASSIGFGADTALTALREKGDDFRVKSITVSAVPVPTAGLLLLGALGALGVARRRSN